MSLSTSLLWRGIVAVVIGVVSVAWPGITIGAFAVLFAVYAFAAGVLEIVRAFGSERAGPVVGWLLLALLSIAAGVVALAWPGITALVLTIWIGAWALTAGVLEVALTFRQGQTAGERAAWILGGLVSIALAVVLFIRPDIGAVSLAEVFGLFSLFYGILGIVQSVRARHVSSNIRKLVDRPA
ncbi:HdeD family acid-resistance protein [Actinoplanes sp. CA-054009]